MSPVARPAVSIWLLRTSTSCAERPYLPKKSNSWAIQSGATRGLGLGYPITTRVGVEAACVMQALARTVYAANAHAKQSRNSRQRFAKVKKRAIKDTSYLLANRKSRHH